MHGLGKSARKGSKTFWGGLALALTLTACESEAPANVAPANTVPGIEISNARMMLAPVSGNPAAVYFDLSYSGEDGLSISGAEVTGAASATIHDMMEYNFEMTMAETAPIAVVKGTEISFEPGGKHVMAFELEEGIEPGATAKVTLKILGGDRHSFDAEVLAAGDDR